MFVYRQINLKRGRDCDIQKNLIYVRLCEVRFETKSKPIRDENILVSIIFAKHNI